ncbi:ELM2 domain protein [Hirschfeldia incana]|nr:ELM2 domain protein [Hirschfeldia incana]
MGFKRPLDDNKFHELPFKHSRQLGFNDKSMQFEEFIPPQAASQSPLATVDEGGLLKPQGGEKTFDEESSFVFPGLDMDGCFDRVMEDCQGEDATQSPHSTEYFELGLVPPRTFAPFETFYSFLLDQPARKQVPIGPDHQAMIPEWEGSLNGNLEPLGTGTCVIPMPAHMDGIVGKGREFCICHDMGSIRCVRQHVKEAREEVVKVLGFEKFRDLGFCDMGEEVAQRWSDEDALLFHQVVYSNPVTLGRNFWKHLEAAFFSRTKHEIVNYYFNVFVLRRRATQNRSMILEIDSDDDEWHGGYGGGPPLGTQYVEEEEDSVVESPLHQGAERFNEKVHPLHQEEGEEDASISNSDEDDTRLCNEHKMDATNIFCGCNEERFNVEDDSCTTFELAQDAVNSGGENCANKD